MNYNFREKKKQLKCTIYLNKKKGIETAETKIIGDKESLYQGLSNLLTIFLDNGIFEGEELCDIIKNVLEHSGKYNVHIREWRE